jgi:hypothetical protein
MDYMMARVPVVHSVEAGNDPVADSGCGLSVPPQDPQALAAGLQRLAALPVGERRRWVNADVPSCWRTTAIQCWPVAFSRRFNDDPHRPAGRSKGCRSSGRDAISRRAVLRAARPSPSAATAPAPPRSGRCCTNASA